jgi:hypothetical protein
MAFRSLAARNSSAALLAVLLLCGGGCRREGDARSAAPPWPRRSVVAGDAAALRRVLERLERMKGTPLARSAAELRGRVADCEQFEIALEPGGRHDLLGAARCAPLAEQHPAVQALRENGDLVFVLDLGGQTWLAGHARVSPPGAVTLQARLLAEDESSALARWLIPDAEPPGPARLSGDATLVHARFHPAAGLDIAGLVGTGTQADDMFRLKSQVFSSAVLSGPWEAALYLPPDGRFLPPLALAADVRMESAAGSAVRQFLDEITKRWPMRRQPFEVAGAAGECLPDVRLIPDLVPCYVLGRGALMVGSSPEALRIALQGQPGVPPPQAGGFMLHLSRFPEADARLQKRTGARAPDPGFGYPWDLVAGQIAREQGSVQVQVKLGLRAGS